MKKESVETVETVEEPIEETVNEAEEMVKITLPLSMEKQNDVFVSVNGRNFQLQRGVELEVPKVVYEVLQNSMKMDMLAFQRQQALMNQSI